MSTLIDIRVRYAETDAMGIAHHSAYLAWLEVARGEFVRGTGFSYRDIEQQGILMPVLRAELHYKQPVIYDDLLTIVVSMQRLTVARVVFDYQILRVGECVTTATTEHAFTTRELKPTNLAKVLPDFWAALNAALSGK